jgi:hypothetical protein
MSQVIWVSIDKHQIGENEWNHLLDDGLHFERLTRQVDLTIARPNQIGV